MNFSETIIKLLVDYRRLLKRHLPAEEHNPKINLLGLQRHLIKRQSDVHLYRTAHLVVQDLENWLKNHMQTASWYSGLDEFLQYLKSILANHRVENSKVVNITQLASRASVEAIQLLTFNSGKLNKPETERLANCATLIAKYGTGEQQKLFNNVLQQKLGQHQAVFSPIMQHYEQHLTAMPSFAE